MPAGGDVSEPDFVSQRGDEFVAAGGEIGGDAAFALVETGGSATVRWPGAFAIP